KNGKTSYTFTRAGNKKIVFTVKTEDGQTASDTALVTVTNMAPKVTIGDDIMAKSGRKIKFNGNAEDPDGKIALYEWDFDGDGTVDFSSTENGFAEHEFEKYSRVILTVTDSDGAKASDSLNVIICPDGMETVEKGKYCIDTYEYPNKKGTEPLLNVTYQEARELCAKQGKHLCSSQEWEYACNESDEKNIYPYGKTFIQDNCNTLGNRIVKNKVSVSGAFSHCRSSLGVYDMSGNAAEWIESNEKTPVVRGGSWQNNESDGKCTSKFQLQGGKKYFYVGFRCCK
ncbi:MAG: SUMF1/EgtB/PvdO family nonheme iron enzyme, partial [Fibrobacter sp.]|nr:SUMF1/EgtB/PvdO family nonheme iron enzyme [Fibrobacter sp.]